MSRVADVAIEVEERLAAGQSPDDVAKWLMETFKFTAEVSGQFIVCVQKLASICDDRNGVRP